MEKKTEKELRQEIIDEYDFDEGDKRVDSILEIKKDKYTAIQQKKKERELKEQMEKGKDFYKAQTKKDPKKGKEEPKGESSLTPKDSARLLEAKVPVDDWDDVIDYAKFKKISIADAMKSSVVKGTLAGKAEERKTAKATNTGKGKKGSSGVSGATALAKAERDGTMPESDAELDALLEERYNK